MNAIMRRSSGIKIPKVRLENEIGIVLKKRKREENE